MDNRLSTLGQVLGRAIFLISLIGVVACGFPSSGGLSDQPISYDKGDGLDSIKTLWRDYKNLDLADLLARGAGFATDQLNQLLAFGPVSAEVGAPKLYKVEELDALVTGLAARFGESELTTQVNRLRREHLQTSGDVVFAEGSFKIKAGIEHGWNLESLGLKGAIPRIGFELGGELEGRSIAAFPDKLTGLGSAMLKALQEMRGFILPRSLVEIRAMKPGELFALRGAGHAAFNLGVGIPILIAEPTTFLTYSVVISAGLRVGLSGQLDIQLVRLDGDRVVVDVGMSSANVCAANIALEDGWGVAGLVAAQVLLAGHQVDLGKLADNALTNLLNQNINAVSAHVEHSQRISRLSVARFIFSLDSQDQRLEQALAQTLRGDLRLAQALAQVGAAGVINEFDLSRAGVTTSSRAGLDLLGISFFTELIEQEGSIILRTPGGTQTYLFESVHKGGTDFVADWLYPSTHGYTRVALSGMRFSNANPTQAQGEANLFIQILDEAEAFKRDLLLDHLDGLLLGLGGWSALDAAAGAGNELQQLVHQECVQSLSGLNPFSTCAEDILQEPGVTELRSQGEQALRAAAQVLDDERAKELLLAVGRLRLATQAAAEFELPTVVCPPSAVSIDARLDDGALSTIMSINSGEQLKARIVDYLLALSVIRGENPDPDQMAEERQRVEITFRAELDDITAAFQASAEQYQRILAVERASIKDIGQLAGRALEIRLPLDDNGNLEYASAEARALPKARAQLFAELFDWLVGFGNMANMHGEKLALYTLLSTTPTSKKDFRVNIQFNLDDERFSHYRLAGYQNLDHYLRGAQVVPIDGGVFNIDALLKLEN